MTNSLKTSTELNQKFKRKWITALRSGDYEQGEGYLKTGGEQQYCCLGVACKIAGIRACDISNKSLPSELSQTLQAKLPPFFRTDDDNDHHEMITTLAEMNDDGSTFEEIADYIEENL